MEVKWPLEFYYRSQSCIQRDLVGVCITSFNINRRSWNSKNNYIMVLLLIQLKIISLTCHCTISNSPQAHLTPGELESQRSTIESSELKDQKYEIKIPKARIFKRHGKKKLLCVGIVFLLGVLVYSLDKNIKSCVTIFLR